MFVLTFAFIVACIFPGEGKQGRGENCGSCCGPCLRLLLWSLFQVFVALHVMVLVVDLLWSGLVVVPSCDPLLWFLDLVSVVVFCCGALLRSLLWFLLWSCCGRTVAVPVLVLVQVLLWSCCGPCCGPCGGPCVAVLVLVLCCSPLLWSLVVVSQL